MEVSGGHEAVVAVVQPLDAQGRVLGRRGATDGPARLRLPDDHGVVVLATQGREVLPVVAVRRDEVKVDIEVDRGSFDTLKIAGRNKNTTAPHSSYSNRSCQKPGTKFCAGLDYVEPQQYVCVVRCGCQKAGVA